VQGSHNLFAASLQYVDNGHSEVLLGEGRLCIENGREIWQVPKDALFG
jgi:hypothetical protein